MAITSSPGLVAEVVRLAFEAIVDLPLKPTALSLLAGILALNLLGAVSLEVARDWSADALGEIVERMELGYSGFDVHRFRRRHSGVRLYESIVYARK